MKKLNQADITKNATNQLKNSISMPNWASFVKTGVNRERAPTQPDWWFTRAASILLKVNDLGPVGVSKLRTKYGGIKNRGNRPEKRFKASGKIIRTILQQLEKAELIKKDEKGKYKGRVITKKGKEVLFKGK